MEKIDVLLNQLKDVTAPEDINEKILRAVYKDTRRLKFFAGLLFIATAINLSFLLYSLRLLILDISDSSLSEILKLIASDWTQVRTSLDTWLMAVIEALPVGSLIMVLGAVFTIIFLINRIDLKAMTRKYNNKLKEVM